MINENTPLGTRVIGLASHDCNSKIVGARGRIISKTFFEKELISISVQFEKDIEGHTGSGAYVSQSRTTIGESGKHGYCWNYGKPAFNKLRILSSDSEVEE